MPLFLQSLVDQHLCVVCLTILSAWCLGHVQQLPLVHWRRQSTQLTTQTAAAAVCQSFQSPAGASYNYANHHFPHCCCKCMHYVGASFQTSISFKSAFKKKKKNLSYKCLFVPCRKLGYLTWVRHNRHKSSATHSCQCVQCLHVSKQWCDCQSFGFLTCAQIMMHMSAHGGCTDTVRESALEADSGRKSHAAPGTRAHCSIGPRFSVYQLSYPHPLHPTLPPIRSSCQKCRWQVTAKHAYTLRMWLCMKWHCAWLYGVHRMRWDGSRFMWHQLCQHCKCTTSVDIQKRAIK